MYINDIKFRHENDESIELFVFNSWLEQFFK